MLSGTTTRAEAFAILRRTFVQAGLDTPDLDARILLVGTLGVAPAELALRPDEPVGNSAAERLCELQARRTAGEPVARILGFTEFWSLTFELSPETLVPRPDTETVVEAALALFPDRAGLQRILDLGTGSGCLLVTLLHELRDAWGLGVDRSPGALAIARRNARRNRVGERAAFAASDWTAALAGTFDLVVSNPPYVPTAELSRLSAEVRLHDPRRALDGGPDGLAAYRVILADANRLLTPSGTLVLEIGYDQEEALRSLADAAGLAVRRTARDLGGRPRAVVIGRQEA
jgi:release factor glutamine methyltransferase